MIDPQKWQILKKTAIAFIQCDPLDRQFVIKEIARYSESEEIYYANLGFDNLQKVEIRDSSIFTSPTSYRVDTIHPSSVVIRHLKEFPDSKAVFIYEGLGEIQEALSHELRNYYFGNFSQKLILLDRIDRVPLDLFSIMPNLKFEIPDLAGIESYISWRSDIRSEFISALYGLPIGEIELLLEQQYSLKAIVDYKSTKLAKQGLKILPKPDVAGVGGLDLLQEDLQKIKCLFSREAKDRGLSPPKAGCLWGLPGTGKSLIVKTMSQTLDVPLVACDWNQLLDADLARSLANLQHVLDVVDKIGNCLFAFDEFEKAFAGWNSNTAGGVLAKMAGKLLTWMQDHETPVIMLATINRLDMLPPELIRRFEYLWFFDSDLHNGAMWEIFKIHLEKHFPGYSYNISDREWRLLFRNYRGCSPAEIAAAVKRTHHEIFFKQAHLNLSISALINELILERAKFEPAIYNKNTSNALAEIRSSASTARPVRGEDKSQFSRIPRGLLEPKPN